MPTILVKDVLFRVSSQLNDISPQFTRWTERELVQYLNDAQKVIAKYMPASCSLVGAMKLAENSSMQVIDSISTANFKLTPSGAAAAATIYGNSLLGLSRNMGANGTTPGRAIRLVDREILDTNNPDWHTAVGTNTTGGSIVTQYTFDPRTPKVFYISPIVPAGGTHWVELSMLANPFDVTVPAIGATAYAMGGSSSVTIGIDDKFIDDLVAYILARCFLKDATFAGKSGLATAHAQMFVNSINAQVTAATGVNPNLSSLPLNPNLAAAAK